MVNSTQMTLTQNQFLSEVGGLNNKVVDIFGNIIPICDLREGFTASARDEFMEQHQVNNFNLYCLQVHFSICLLDATKYV